MSRRTLLCEKLTEYTRSLVWTGQIHTDRDTGTILEIPAQYPGLIFLQNVRSSLALYILAAVITVIAIYLSFVGSTMYCAPVDKAKESALRTRDRYYSIRVRHSKLKTRSPAKCCPHFLLLIASPTASHIPSRNR